MASIKFFTRTTKKQGNLVPVYCRLRYGRDIDRTTKSGIQVQPDHFNNNTGFVRQIVEATYKDRINGDLRNLKNFIFNELPNGNDVSDIRNDWLRVTIDKYWNPEKYKEKVIDLFSFIQNFINKAPTRINSKSGHPVSYKMVREYERTFHYLKEYSKQIDENLDFQNMDLDFYNSFIEYLKNEKLATNTIGKKIQTLKIFLNAATDQGYNQFKQYKHSKFIAISEESESIYLNQDELQAIYNLNLSDNPKLDRVRDLFIVGCWTGVRFSDISQITPESIVEGFISIRQSKTGGKVVIPVHPTVEATLGKYDGKLPPIISNQRFNEYLKDVAKEADLDDVVHISMTKGGIKISTAYKKWELVTSHTGRRSFATNNYLMGVPTLTIMAITGHRTEASFLKYIKVTPKEHAEKLRVIWQSQVKMKAV